MPDVLCSRNNRSHSNLLLAYEPAMPDTRKTDPLHGVTLEAIVTKLQEHYGWEELGGRIPARCFNFDPSIKSSLTFLRKTPWARTKVEKLYLATFHATPRQT